MMCTCGIFVEQILKKARELNLADSEICVVSRLVLNHQKVKANMGMTEPLLLRCLGHRNCPPCTWIGRRWRMGRRC